MEDRVEFDLERVGVKIGLASTKADRIRCAHDPTCILVVPEWVAHEVFDDKLHGNNNAEQATFNTPMGSDASSHEFFHERSHADVIWDEEIAHELYTCDHNVFAAGAVEHSEVVSMTSLWSEDTSHDLLQHLSRGMDEQMPRKRVLDSKELLPARDTTKVFNETFDSISLSGGQENSQNEMIQEVVWDDEVPPNPGLHRSLFQQLASSVEDLGCVTTQASAELESVDKTKLNCMRAAQSNEKWLRLHDRLGQLHIRFWSIDTKHQRLTAQLVQESKMLNQAANGYRVMAKQLMDITQDVLRLANFRMSRALEVFKSSTLGTCVPWRLGVLKPDVLFPSVGDNLHTNISMVSLNQKHQEIKVNTNCLVDIMPLENERSDGNYRERGEAFLSLQESSVSCAAPEPVWDEDIQCCLDAHYGLLEQPATSSEYMDDERTNQIAKLGVSDVHIRTDSLLISPELDLFSAKRVLEGILNEDLDKDILVGLEQLYGSSEKGAQQKSRNISLLAINEWSDAFGDLESPEMHMLRAQTGQEEANLGAPDYQLCKVVLGVSGFVSYLSWVLQLDIAIAQDFAEMPAVQEMNRNHETFAISEEKQEVSDLQIMFAEFQQWMKLHTCKIQEAHEIPNMNKYSLYKVAASSRRQWNPGIMKLHVIQLGCECQCCHGSYSWTVCSNVVCKHLLNTTAWGQAVFRGGGNVMTLIWPRRSPTDVRPIDPSLSPSAAQEATLYREVSSTGEGIEDFRNRNRRGTGELLPPPTRDPIPPLNP